MYSVTMNCKSRVVVPIVFVFSSAAVVIHGSVLRTGSVVSNRRARGHVKSPGLT